MTDTDPFSGSSGGVTNILLTVLVGLVAICFVTFLYYHVWSPSHVNQTENNIKSDLIIKVPESESMKPMMTAEPVIEMSHLDDPVLTHIHMNAHGMQQPALSAFLI